MPGSSAYFYRCIVSQWHSHHLPRFQRRQEKEQDKLPTFKWKMFEAANRSKSTYMFASPTTRTWLHGHLFITTLCPLLFEGNLNQISLKTVYFMSVLQGGEGWKECHLIFRALLQKGRTEGQDKQNMPTLWISEDLGQTRPLNKKQGIFFFCVYHGSTVTQACLYSIQTLN